MQQLPPSMLLKVTRLQSRSRRSGNDQRRFKIHINEDNDLVISMEKKTESTEGDKEGKKESRYLRREFSYSKFQQTLILPDDVDKIKLMQK